MNLQNLLRELVDERQRLDDAIIALRRLNPNPSGRRKNRLSNKRRKMSDSTVRAENINALAAEARNNPKIILFPAQQEATSGKAAKRLLRKGKN